MSFFPFSVLLLTINIHLSSKLSGELLINKISTPLNEGGIELQLLYT